MNANKRYWYLCVGLALALTLITLSPVVLTLGEHKPTLLSVPYTLWTSILTTAGLVGLTTYGSRYLLRDENIDEL